MGYLLWVPVLSKPFRGFIPPVRFGNSDSSHARSELMNYLGILSNSFVYFMPLHVKINFILKPDLSSFFAFVFQDENHWYTIFLIFPL